MIYVDFEGDGINEALLNVFASGDEDYSHIGFHILLSIKNGEITVVYSVYDLPAEDERHFLQIMRETGNGQFVLVREERIGGFDGTVATIIYDYVDGEVSQRVRIAGSSPRQLEDFESWWD